MAAIMELEAKIAEDMDSESSDNETTSIELTPVGNALPLICYYSNSGIVVNPKGKSQFFSHPWG